MEYNTKHFLEDIIYERGNKTNSPNAVKKCQMPINIYGQAIDDNPYILGATHSYKDMYRQGHKFTHIFLYLSYNIYFVL